MCGVVSKLFASLLFVLFLIPAQTQEIAKSIDKGKIPDIATKTKDMEAHEGYFKFYWDAKEGKIWLEINELDTEFLYVNSLAAGVGSNDIGLEPEPTGR